MSAEKIWEIILNIAQIAVLAAVIIIMVRKIKKPRGPFAAFFIFAMAAYLLDDIYWVAYDFLRPDKWMPFAANEIAGSATLLLLGSALSMKVKKDVPVKVTEIVFSLVFLGGCVWLWGTWSGEWIQNLVFTLPYMYFMNVLLRGMRSTKALTVPGTCIAALICIAIIALDVLALYVSEGMAETIYNINYVILNGSTLCLYGKLICDKRKGRPAEIFLFQSFAIFFWTMLVFDMSSGLFYNIGIFLHTPAIILMSMAVLSVNEKEEPAGIGGIS